MAITEFNLKIPNRRVHHQYTGLVTYEREYEAILDEPEDNEEMVLADPLVPLMYTAHPEAFIAPAIVVDRKAESRDETRLIWRVLISYGQHAINPFDGGDESFDPDRLDEDNLFKQRVTWQFTSRQEPLQAARLLPVAANSTADFPEELVPVTSSALLRYDPLPSVDVYEPFVTVTRNILSASPMLLEYVNSMNSNSVTIGGLTILPEAARMANLTLSAPKKDKDSGTVFYTLTMPIYLRPYKTVRISTGENTGRENYDTKEIEISGWDIPLLDHDHYHFKQDSENPGQKVDPPQLVRFKDDDLKDDLDRPNLLNDGNPVLLNDPPSGDELRLKAVYRVYRHLRELDWTNLQLR